jgi:hypothetical protein
MIDLADDAASEDGEDIIDEEEDVCGLGTEFRIQSR